MVVDKGKGAVRSSTDIERKRTILNTSIWTLFAVFIGIGVIFAYRDLRDGQTLTWSGLCTPVGLVGEGLGLGLTVNCDGELHKIISQQLALSYAINPGPVSCMVYVNIRVTCAERPFK